MELRPNVERIIASMEIRPSKQYLIICKIGVTPFSSIFDKITKGVTPRNPEKHSKQGRK